MDSGDKALVEGVGMVLSVIRILAIVAVLVGIGMLPFPHLKLAPDLIFWGSATYLVLSLLGTLMKTTRRKRAGN